jgi:hypothetical protein
VYSSLAECLPSIVAKDIDWIPRDTKSKIEKRAREREREGETEKDRERERERYDR